MRSNPLLPTALAVALAALGAGAPGLAAQDDDDAFFDTRRQRDFREYLSPDFYEVELGRARVTDRIQVRGHMKFEQWFDDNIFLKSTGRESDSITAAVPELKVKYEQERVTLKADYRGRQQWFADHSELDGVQHDALGDLRYETGDFRVQIWDAFAVTTEPDIVIFPERIERRINTAGAAVAAILNRLEVEVGAGLKRFDVDDDVFSVFDHRARSLSASGSLQVSAELYAILEAASARTEFDEDAVFNGFEIRSAMGGIRTRSSGKTAVELKAGPFQLNLDETPGAVPQDDAHGLMGHAIFWWRVSQSTLVRAAIKRDPEEVLSAGWALFTKAEVTVEQWLAERVQARAILYFERVDFADGGSHQRGVGANFRIEYSIGSNIMADAWVEYRTAVNSDSGDDLSNVHGYVGLGVKW